jgi:hypothetical protein
MKERIQIQRLSERLFTAPDLRTTDDELNFFEQRFKQILANL